MAADHAMGWGVEVLLILHLVSAGACLVSAIITVTWKARARAREPRLMHGSRG